MSFPPRPRCSSLRRWRRRGCRLEAAVGVVVKPGQGVGLGWVELVREGDRLPAEPSLTGLSLPEVGGRVDVGDRDDDALSESMSEAAVLVGDLDLDVSVLAGPSGKLHWKEPPDGRLRRRADDSHAVVAAGRVAGVDREGVGARIGDRVAVGVLVSALLDPPPSSPVRTAVGGDVVHRPPRTKSPVRAAVAVGDGDLLGFCACSRALGVAALEAAAAVDRVERWHPRACRPSRSSVSSRLKVSGLPGSVVV